MPLFLRRYIRRCGYFFLVSLFIVVSQSSVSAQNCQWVRQNGTACNDTGGYVSSGYNPYYEQTSCAGTPYYAPFTNSALPCSSNGTGTCYLFTNAKTSHCSKSYKQQVPGTSNNGQCESQPSGGGCWTGGTVYNNVEQCRWECPATPTPSPIPTNPPAGNTSGVNVAKGKPVIKYNGNVNYGDTQNSWPKVNDGDVNTHWLVSTNPATDVVIDLQQEYKIWSINYAAFWDSNFGSGAVLSTYISKDNQTWEKVDTREIFDTRTAIHSVLVNEKPGRYVRIVWENSVGSSWNGWAEFKEIMVYTKPTTAGWVRPNGSACTVAANSTTASVGNAVSVHYSKANCFAYATSFYLGGHNPSATNTSCSTDGSGKCFYLSNHGQTSWLSWRNPGAACKNYDATYPNYVAGNRNDNAFRSIEECLWNSSATQPTAVTSASTVPTNPPVVTAGPNCALQSKGDADCNGAVQSEDWTIWSKFYLDTNYTPTQSHYKGDFNNDGKSDLKDAEIWRMCFTTNCAGTGPTSGTQPTAAATTVPTNPPATSVPTKTISPTAPPGCRYVQVQCVRAPCPPQLECVSPTVTQTNTALDSLKQKFVQDESSVLAANTTVASVKVKSDIVMTWNNGCRGCGGNVCTQALVTGRRVVLYGPANSGTNQCVFHVYHVTSGYASACSPPTGRTVTSCNADPFPPPTNNAAQ